MPTFEPSSLVSGGGDPYMNVWDWMSGTLKCQLPIADAVKPFLKVRENRNKWHGGQGSSSGARGRKGRNKEKNVEESTVEVTKETAEASPKPSGETVPENESEEDLVFALAKVEAFEFRNEKFLVFSAIGYVFAGYSIKMKRLNDIYRGSAVFYCAYPSEPSNNPSVQHIDFSSPVLDFVLGDGCQVLVSVDAAWSGSAGTAVRLIEWVEGEVRDLCIFIEQFADNQQFRIAENITPLLNSLNDAGLREG
jgi:tRNA (guanine-N(7)-)-methyltransferase subunit TRM82